MARSSQPGPSRSLGDEIEMSVDRMPEDSAASVAHSTLSWAQVESSGLNAWLEELGYRYRFEALSGSIWFEGPLDRPGTYPWRLASPRRAPASGWSHFADCSCEVCVLGAVSPCLIGSESTAPREEHCDDAQ